MRSPCTVSKACTATKTRHNQKKKNPSKFLIAAGSMEMAQSTQLDPCHRWHSKHCLPGLSILGQLDTTHLSGHSISIFTVDFFSFTGYPRWYPLFSLHTHTAGTSPSLAWRTTSHVWTTPPQTPLEPGPPSSSDRIVQAAWWDLHPAVPPVPPAPRPGTVPSPALVCFSPILPLEGLPPKHPDNGWTFRSLLFQENHHAPC